MKLLSAIVQGWKYALSVGVLSVLALGVPNPAFGSHTRGERDDKGVEHHDRRPENRGADTAVDAALARYVKDVQSASHDAIRPPGYRRFLLEQARLADHFSDRGRLCLAEGVLRRLRRDLAPWVRTEHRHWSPRIASDLGATLSADILNAEARLLSSPGTQRCGGASAPTSPTSSPLVTVASADAQQVTFHVAFPPARFVPRQSDGQQFLELMMSGMGGGDRGVGAPELPRTSALVAVPLGASVSLELLGTSGFQLPAVQLWPLQPEPPAASVTAAPDLGPLPPGPSPFVFDRAAYTSTRPMPSALANAGAVESMRGLPLSGIAITGARYVPSTRMLTVLTGMDIKVTFGGRNTGVFGTTDLASVWNLAFQHLYARAVVNWGTAKQDLSPVPIPADLFCGEEMMVVTTAALEPAATQFAADRTAHGVRARVFVIGTPGGIPATPTGIRNAIAREYNSPDCELHPSYVTIVGDTDQVPTFEISFGVHDTSKGPKPNFYEDPVATDMPYGFIHQASQVDAGKIVDYNPDLLVGRLSASDLATAQTEVATITGYEDTPPLVSPAYGTVVADAFFQPCPDNGCVDNNVNPPLEEAPSSRTPYSFLRSSELAGGAATFAGKTLRRVYADESDHEPSAMFTPLTYDDDSPIPFDVKVVLALFHGQTTDQLVADVAHAVNQGAFLVWHADHGYVSGGGWYEAPFYTSSVIGSVQKPALPPVVWSSDCDSGKFDDPQGLPYVSNGSPVSYSEQWLQQGSAVATVGASRESPITGDGIMLQRMGSALFPEAYNATASAFHDTYSQLYNQLFGVSLPPYQPVQPITRVGPLLIASKLAMSAAYGGNLSQSVGAAGTWLEYNEFGDPSMAIRRDRPITFERAPVSATLVGVHSVLVQTRQTGLDGAVVTLTRDGEYIGRGLLADGAATIDVPGGLETLDGVQAIVSGGGTIPATVDLAQASGG